MPLAYCFTPQRLCLLANGLKISERCWLALIDHCLMERSFLFFRRLGDSVTRVVRFSQTPTPGAQTHSLKASNTSIRQITVFYIDHLFFNIMYYFKLVIQHIVLSTLQILLRAIRDWEFGQSLIHFILFLPALQVLPL